MIKTPLGAIGFYHTVVASIGKVIDPLVGYLGLLTDELAGLPMPVGVVAHAATLTTTDSRQQLDVGLWQGHPFDASGLGTSPYAAFHILRAQAREARGFLNAYLPDSSAALRGHLYALEGYADVFLADVFCSGIPLSTVDFDGDYTLAPGSTTAEVYAAAAALFDSALTLTGDSARLHQFAAVGKGRTLLALQRYADAAAAVATVPTDFQYNVAYADPVSPSVLSDFLRAFGPENYGVPSIGDREGQNGLDYLSSGDPRIPVYVPAGADRYGNTMAYPAKYPTTAPITFVLADGIEARLIEAEAALAAGSDWLSILNTLRTDGTFDTQPNAEDPSKTDTLWHAGTGGVAGLRPLAEPGNSDARIDLMFRERAFWLYLTAHRQGDLRRLIRQYPVRTDGTFRTANTVYPSGAYPGGTGQYGTEIAAPVPATEAQYNPHYTGCFHRNA